MPLPLRQTLAAQGLGLGPRPLPLPPPERRSQRIPAGARGSRDDAVVVPSGTTRPAPTSRILLSESKLHITWIRTHHLLPKADPRALFRAAVLSDSKRGRHEHGSTNQHCTSGLGCVRSWRAARPGATASAGPLASDAIRKRTTVSAIAGDVLDRNPASHRRLPSQPGVRRRGPGHAGAFACAAPIL